MKFPTVQIAMKIYLDYCDEEGYVGGYRRFGGARGVRIPTNKKKVGWMNILYDKTGVMGNFGSV